MDGYGRAIIDKIYALGAPGRYFVVSEDEFYACLPEGETSSPDGLKKRLKQLAAAGYIDLHCTGGDMYCVALLKKYEPEPEPEPSPAIPRGQAKNEKTGRLTLFWAAFAGAALGGAATSLISLLFLLC